MRRFSFIDNSKFTKTDTRYTLLPSNGRRYLYNESSDFEKQSNFRTLWGVDSLPMGESPINYSGQTLPSYNHYHKTITNKYSITSNYKKIIDLIAVFKSDILDMFEDAFLDFAGAKLNEEITYKPYDVKYTKFQDLLKEVSYEDLERRTLENNEAVRNDFRFAFDNYAKENGLYNYAENPITKSEVITSNIDKMIFDYDGSSKEDKEDLFKLKLKVFELSIVKDSEDRKLKSGIRKADNPLDVFYYYKLILDNTK